jgi:methionine biosynthesis protein MetW
MLKRKDLQTIADFIEPESRVLDLGCGDGALLNELINEKKVKGIGIEISLERIKKCLERGISVVQEDLNEGLNDFQDHSFDYVILSHTLEDISKPVYLIHEMLRVGKKCIISFENLAHWKNRISFLFSGNVNSGGNKKDLLQDGEKQQILTINKFFKFCSYYKFTVCKQIFLPNGKISLTNTFPNFYSKTAIFILKGN